MDDITKFFRSIFKSKKPTADGEPLSHLRQDNPYNEIQLLTEHSDIIRAFACVGPDKFVQTQNRFCAEPYSPFNSDLRRVLMTATFTFGTRRLGRNC